MKQGAFRSYFKLPFLPYGIKVPRWDKSNSIPAAAFLCAIVMNINERKRYLYYTLKRSMKHGGRIINIDKYHGSIVYKSAALVPTYFSFFGLFNIVRHVEQLNKEPTLKAEDVGYLALNDEIREHNVGTYKGKELLLDYGDFRIDGWTNITVGWIDYA